MARKSEGPVRQSKSDTCVVFLRADEIDVREPYFVRAVGGTGIRTAPWHLPLAVLAPVRRPDASRWVLVTVPDVPPLAVSLPVRRPEASRYWLLEPELPVNVLALPAIWPLALR